MDVKGLHLTVKSMFLLINGDIHPADEEEITLTVTGPAARILSPLYEM